MKLRLHANSLRLRVTRPELAALLAGGRIAETVHFSPDPDASLTYALTCADCATVQVHRTRNEIAVAMPWDRARHWAQETEVSVRAEIPLPGASLSVLIEKDFACLHGSDEENRGTFPNPKAAV